MFQDVEVRELTTAERDQLRRVGRLMARMSPAARQSLQNLEGQVRFFEEEMWSKLLAKAEQGETGWDDPSRRGLLQARLVHAVERARKGEGSWVDVANFALFLWYQDEILPDRWDH